MHVTPSDSQEANFVAQELQPRTSQMCERSSAVLELDVQVAMASTFRLSACRLQLAHLVDL